MAAAWQADKNLSLLDQGAEVLLMGWLDFLRGSRASHLASVTFDEVVVACRHPDGSTQSIRWADLQEVRIETTNAGPFLDDVFWVLSDQESQCVIPSESLGVQLLLERLQTLPSFDNNAVIRAMSCAENQQFICWRRQGVADSRQSNAPG